MGLFTKIKDISFSSNFAKKSRILAVIYILVEFLVLAIIALRDNEFNVFAVIAHSIFFFFGVVLIIKPSLLILWAIYFMIEGFALFWVSESLLGLIFLLAGIFFFLKLDFFKSHKRYKIFLLVLLFFIAMFMFYLKNGFQVKYSRIVELIIGILSVVAIFVLMHDDFKKYYTNKPLLKLEDNLTERQRLCIDGILKGKSLKNIAISLYVSESVVKREVKTVYKIFGVENHKDFVKFLNDHDVMV